MAGDPLSCTITMSEESARAPVAARTTQGKPIVAIVGRANVGKSTLFNRIVRRRTAIVEDMPGTTRDRLYSDASWDDREFLVVDTGGLEVSPGTPLSQSIKRQVEAAMSEADVLLFVVDARAGLTPADWEIADVARRSTVPVILVANKAEDPKHDLAAAEFNQIGLGEPLPTSGYHGRNVGELLDQVVSLLPLESPALAPSDTVKVAIVGRPNVGKSMLLNAILGEERAIVSEVPGTTRDTLDAVVQYDGRQAVVIDTAGVRRRGQVQPGIEYYSVLRALRAVTRSDVSLLVIDGSEGVTAQDLHVAGYIRDSFRGMIILVNKWDLVAEDKKEEVAQQVQDRFRFAPYAPVMFISAKLGQGIDPILPEAEKVWRERWRKVQPVELEKFLKEVLSRHGPSRSGTRQLKVFSVEQAAGDPPTFMFTVNDPEIVHFSYQRYLENRLRESFGFHGSPLRLVFRKKSRRGSGSGQRAETQGG